MPPTLIQPFVENAIWHGLLPKPGGNCHVAVTVSKSADQEQFTIIVEDNGIGRDVSETKRAKLPVKRKSLGMEITAERIAML